MDTATPPTLRTVVLHWAAVLPAAVIMVSTLFGLQTFTPGGDAAPRGWVCDGTLLPPFGEVLLAWIPLLMLGLAVCSLLLLLIKEGKASRWRNPALVSIAVPAIVLILFLIISGHVVSVDLIDLIPTAQICKG